MMRGGDPGGSGGRGIEIRGGSGGGGSSIFFGERGSLVDAATGTTQSHRFTLGASTASHRGQIQPMFFDDPMA
jgi:hypothetical protein